MPPTTAKASKANAQQAPSPAGANPDVRPDENADSLDEAAYEARLAAEAKREADAARLAELEAAEADRQAAAEVSAVDEYDDYDDSDSLSAGDLVSYTLFDPLVGAGGADVVHYGVVTELVDDDVAMNDGSHQTITRARVASLPNVSDPLSLDDLRKL